MRDVSRFRRLPLCALALTLLMYAGCPGGSKVQVLVANMLEQYEVRSIKLLDPDTGDEVGDNLLVGKIPPLQGRRLQIDGALVAGVTGFGARINQPGATDSDNLVEGELLDTLKPGDSTTWILVDISFGVAAGELPTTSQKSLDDRTP